LRKEGKRDSEFVISLSIPLEDGITGKELTLIESVLPEIIREVLNNQETEGS